MRRNPWLPVVLAAVVVVALAVLGVVLLHPGSGSADAGTSTAGSTASASTTATPGVGGTTYLVPTSVSSSMESASSQLATLESNDAAQVSQLEGYWVAQVSSKRIGLVADGITYDDAAILADHARLAARFPRTVLFESDRFASYGVSGFWITAVATPYSTAAEANAWCDAAGLPADGCFAKRLTQATTGQNSVQR